MFTSCKKLKAVKQSYIMHGVSKINSGKIQAKTLKKKKNIVIVVQFKVKPCTYYSVQHADLPDRYYMINVHKAHAQNTCFSSGACIQYFFPDIIS